MLILKVIAEIYILICKQVQIWVLFRYHTNVCPIQIMTILPISPSQQIYFATAMSELPQVKQNKMSHYVLQTISIRGEGGSITDIIDFTLANNGAFNNSISSVAEEVSLTAEDDQNLSKKHRCKKCDKPFEQLRELTNHFAFCDIETGYHLRKADMLKNIKKIERESSKMEELNICFCCGESYDSYHMGPINCTDCSKSFKTQMSYERHIFITHSESDEFPCSICNAKLRTGKLLKLHEAQHKSRGKPFVCKICGKDFSRTDHLKRHQKFTACSASAIDTTSCKVCNKDFSRLDNLRKHLKLHMCIQVTRSKEFTCDICKNSFYSSWNLKRHKQIHTGERPFPCDLCRKKYPSLHALKIHRRLHTGERPFTCAKCDYCFIDRKTLHRHLKRHVCNICGEHFLKVCDVRYHMKTHVCLFACDKCNQKFETIQQLAQHIKTHSLNSKGELKPQIKKFKCYEYKSISGTPEEVAPDYDAEFQIPNYTDSRIKALEKEQLNCAIYVKEFDSVKTLNSHIRQVYKEKLETIHKPKLSQKVKLDRLDTLPTKIFRIDDFNDNITTTNNNAAVLQQFIEDKADEEENSVITLENETRNTEPKTNDPECVVTNNRSSVEDEPTETFTEQLLLENEEFCVLTLENETINIELKTAVPESAVDAIINDRISVEGNADVEQLIKDEPPEMYTEQLLENEEYCILTLEDETINTVPKTGVPESAVDAITKYRTSVEDNAAVELFIKDEPPETSPEQILLENKEFCVLTLENDTLNTEAISAVSESVLNAIAKDRTSVEGEVVAQKFIKNEPPEISTEQFLMKKEVCTVLENENIKIEPETDELESVIDAIANDRTVVESVAQICIKNEVPETSTEQLLLNNEVYTITTLENENVKTKRKTTAHQNLMNRKCNIRSLAKSLVAAVTDPVAYDEKVQIMTVEKEETEEDMKMKSNVRKLLNILVDSSTLTKFGWPEVTEEYVLCRVIENCGYDLGKDRTSYVDCDYSTRMRAYVKLLFSVVLHNDSVMELLNYYPIDDVIKIILDNGDND